VLTATLRPIRDTDWPGIVALEAAAYAELGLSEDPDQLRCRAAEGTSFVLEAGGAVTGYVLALPYPFGRFPTLGEVAWLPPGPSHLHLHDLVVDPAHRRSGLGSTLAGHLFTVARAYLYDRISLVSVGGSGAFWTRHGFQPRPDVPVTPGYGPGATYMTRPL
jgi:ribosomal protein S18 acetylase RimI-like enzyme